MSKKTTFELTKRQMRLIALALDNLAGIYFLFPERARLVKELDHLGESFSDYMDRVIDRMRSDVGFYHEENRNQLLAHWIVRNTMPHLHKDDIEGFKTARDGILAELENGGTQRLVLLSGKAAQ